MSVRAAAAAAADLDEEVCTGMVVEADTVQGKGPRRSETKDASLT